MKAHRLAQPQREAPALQLDRLALGRTARQHAQALLAPALLQQQEIAARRATADARAQSPQATGTQQRLHHSAARHRLVGVRVMQHAQRAAAPALQKIGDAARDRRRAEHAAVEQQRIGHRKTPFAISRARADRRPRSRRMALQEIGQMARDRRIGRIRQAKLDYCTAAPAWSLARRLQRQEAVEHQALDLRPGQLDAARTTHQARSSAQQRNRHRLRRLIRQQQLLGRAAALHQLRQARRRQGRVARQPALGQVCQREVHVVATQHQVVADRDPGQAGHAACSIGLDAHQGEVGRAAADVDHQHQARVLQFIGQALPVLMQPVVQRSLRLLDQAQANQTGQPRSFERQRARALVEGRRHRQRDVLLRQRMIRVPRIPGGSQLRQVAGARGDWRDPVHIIRCPPGQDGRIAIDSGMRQPALGARYQTARHLATQLACAAPEHRRRQLQAAGECRRRPGQAEVGVSQLASRRVVAQRGQQRRLHHLSRPCRLRNAEQLRCWVGILQVSPGQQGVAGAQVDADRVARAQVATRRFRR